MKIWSGWDFWSEKTEKTLDAVWRKRPAWFKAALVVGLLDSVLAGAILEEVMRKSYSEAGLVLLITQFPGEAITYMIGSAFPGPLIETFHLPLTALFGALSWAAIAGLLTAIISKAWKCGRHLVRR